MYIYVVHSFFEGEEERGERTIDERDNIFDDILFQLFQLFGDVLVDASLPASFSMLPRWQDGGARSSPFDVTDRSQNAQRNFLLVSHLGGRSTISRI